MGSQQCLTVLKSQQVFQLKQPNALLVHTQYDHQGHPQNYDPYRQEEEVSFNKPQSPLCNYVQCFQPRDTSQTPSYNNRYTVSQLDSRRFSS